MTASPVAVSGGQTFQSVAAGDFNIGHTCGLTTGGAALCWGDNERGQLGIGSGVTVHPAPTPVSGGLTFAALTAGLGRHTCGLTGTGAAYCWGENTFGGLGNGSTVDRSVPSAVAGGITFTSLEAGYRHTCGHASGGAVYCWGSGAAGQLGNNSTSQFNVPTAVVAP